MLAIDVIPSSQTDAVDAPTDVSFRFLQEIADDLARRDVSFPTFAEATAAVRAALADPQVSAERVASVVSREPLLSVKLVRLANSSALNPTGKAVSDVRTAVIRVGLANVRSVAVAVAYEQLRADRALRQHGARAEAAWRHSVHVAALSRVIAGRMTRFSPDEALFAGLVHDIGYFYLLSRTPRYPELAGHPEALDAILREWHPSIGQAVLHSYKLPDAVIEAVGEHESAPQRIPPRTMADVVRLAVLVAAPGNPTRDPALPAPALRDAQLDAALEAASEELNSLVSALQT